MGNGWHSFFLKAQGWGVRGGRERRTHTDTHTHPTAREEAESRQGREGASGEREREIPKAALCL